MKNILIILAMFLIGFSSCSKDDKVEPDPEPTIDYELIEPEIKERLFDYQSALNDKDYSTAIEITENKDRVEFGIYPTPSVASQSSSTLAITRTLSGVVKNSTSKVANGTVIYTGKQKVVIKKTGVADKELLLNFTATFKCIGDKTLAEDWKLSFTATE